jgi:hypothetical protein
MKTVYVPVTLSETDDVLTGDGKSVESYDVIYSEESMKEVLAQGIHPDWEFTKMIDLEEDHLMKYAESIIYNTY